MLSLLRVGKVMYLSLGLEPKAIVIFIVPLWNVLNIKEIALLLVPDVLRLAVGKIHNAHSLPAFPCPRLNARTSWGCLWLSCGTWSFLCYPQSIVAFCLHLSYGSHTSLCWWGYSPKSFLAWWLMSITSSLDHWLKKKRVLLLPSYLPSNESSLGEPRRLEDPSE